jgi:hypothetical protein
MAGPERTRVLRHRRGTRLTSTEAARDTDALAAAFATHDSPGDQLLRGPAKECDLSDV